MRVILSSTMAGLILFVSISALQLGSADPLIPEDVHWMPTQGSWIETQMLSPEPDSDLPGGRILSFGGEVAVDGDTLVVSTQFDRYQDKWLRCPDGCDWVYVFNKDETGEWVKTHKLVPETAEPGDTFGFSLDLDEDSGVIVVGNPGHKVREDSEHSGLRRKVDQIHIFERQEDGAWVETEVVHRPAPRPNSFGYDVEVIGHSVISGFIPQLFVFQKTEDGWSESDVLQGSHIIAMSDGRIATGIRYHISDCLEERWKYQLYDLEGGTWVPTAVLDPQNETGDRAYTAAGQLDFDENGKTLVMGSPVDRRVFGVHTQYCMEEFGGYNPGPMGAVGSGWIYEEIEDEWVLTADIANPMPTPGLSSSSAYFGFSVGVSNGIAIFGAFGDIYSGGGSNSGATYVYKNTLESWILDARLQKRDSQPQEWFGGSVGISNGTVVVGADWTGQYGSAHTFERIVEL